MEASNCGASWTTEAVANSVVRRKVWSLHQMSAVPSCFDVFVPRPITIASFLAISIKVIPESLRVQCRFDGMISRDHSGDGDISS